MVSIQKPLEPQCLRKKGTEYQNVLYEHVHMCGLMAHAMQMQNPTLINKNISLKIIMLEQFYLQNSLLESLLQVGAKFWGYSVGRRFTQFVGRSRHFSLNYVHYVQFYIFKRAQRPARRGSVSPHRGKFSRAPQHPKDTAGSTLAPISPDPLIQKINK